MANLNYNKVILGGRLTKDPELKTTQSGKAVAGFSMAVSKLGEKGEAEFYDIVAWEKTGEFISKFFHKGSSILLEGRLSTREWTDKEGQKRKKVEVLAEHAYFVDSRSEGGDAGASMGTTTQSPMSGTYTQVSGFEDLAAQYAAMGAQAQAKKPVGATAQETFSEDEDLPF